MSLRLETRLSPAATKQLLEIVEAPEQFPDLARPFRGIARKRIWTVALEGRSIFLKVWRPAPVAGLKAVFRRRMSAGMQTWNIAAAVHASGIPTPTPLAAGERRGLTRRPMWSFFACEWLPDPPLGPLVRAAREWPDEERRNAFVRRLGAAFRTLTERGFVQTDLKPSNFLVRGDPEARFTLLPIDLRSCLLVTPAEARARARTEEKLERRVLKGFPETSVHEFFATYRADGEPCVTGAR
jgi:hypothetical protein